MNIIEALSDPPDLIVSGPNFGHNLGQTATSSSGTIGAALQGVFNDIPAIAVSVEILLLGYPTFESTIPAFPPAADFTVRVIQALQARTKGRRLLPERTMLNINIPVPYEEIEGVKLTRLARAGNYKIVQVDYFNVIPIGGGPVLISADFPLGSGPTKKSDTEALADGFLSISLLDGNMSAEGDLQTLGHLKP